MLTRLSLDLSRLVVSFCNGSCEIPVSRHHNECYICLRGTCDHIFDEVTVTRGIDDGVVPFICVELFCRARNGDTTLTLFFLAVHVESKSERPLAQTLCLSLQLFKFALWKSTELKN